MYGISSELLFIFTLIALNFMVFYTMEYKPFARKDVDNYKVDNELIRDIVCQVYAGNKSKITIDAVLYEFLPKYIELNLDYAVKLDDEKYIFKSEDEMVNYFIETPNVYQTFYWNKYTDNPDKIMVGANILRDNTLVVSLTIDGTQKTGFIYLDRLKHFLNSEIGVITYVNPAGYESGVDFIQRYKK